MLLRLVGFTLFLAGSMGIAASSPLHELKQTVSSVLGILDTNKSLKTKRAEITKIYHKTFDLERMAVNTLKSDYKALNKEQQAQFIKTYGEFVLEFYLAKIDKYTHNKVEFLDEEIHGNRAVVATHYEYQGKMAKLNYSLAKKGDHWLIYDFEVEGVRLSTTYRSQFARVFKQKKFDGLMTELNKLLSKYKK